MQNHWVRITLFPVLLPMSLIYGLAVWFRNLLFDLKLLKIAKFDIPVLSVGNITVGGTGKTPHVEYLIDLLSSDLKTAMLSRGYKRKTKGFLIAVPDSQPEDIGDEPMQVSSKFNNVTVAVDSNRVRGIEQLIKAVNGLKVVILDDAFQHRYVKPKVSIVLVDYNRPVFKDYLLPFGNLREKIAALARANIVIVTKAPENLQNDEQVFWRNKLRVHAQQQIYFTTYIYGNLMPVYDPSVKNITLNNAAKSSSKALLVSGVANPKPIAEYLLSNGFEINQLQYPDHHRYSKNDVYNIQKKYDSMNDRNAILITTEKDAVKLRHLNDFPVSIKEKFYYLPIRVKFLSDKKEDFDSYIFENVTRDL